MGVALDQFEASLELADSLKNIERDKYTNPPTLAHQPYVRGLRGGAAVLMVAAFEFFLSNLFEENISSLNTVADPIDFNRLPDNLKVKTVFHGLKKALAGPLYREKPPKVERIEDIIKACELLIRKEIDPATFSDTGSNPNGNTVQKKFNEVGITDIFSKIKPSYERILNKPVAQHFIKDKLDEIVNTRHVVAHTADTLNITRRCQND